jgi:hypothetical protein
MAAQEYRAASPGHRHGAGHGHWAGAADGLGAAPPRGSARRRCFGLSRAARRMHRRPGLGGLWPGPDGQGRLH